jgi:DNA-binding transcriptional ArsR family regulator
VRHIQAWFTGKLTVALQGPDGLGSLSWESATSSTQPSARQPLKMRGGGVDSQSVWSRSQRGVDPKAGHKGGVSGGSSHPDIGLSQSTVSGYLATLQRVGLVEVRRIGQWTYYKRNEATISALAEIIGKDL